MEGQPIAHGSSSLLPRAEELVKNPESGDNIYKNRNCEEQEDSSSNVFTSGENKQNVVDGYQLVVSEIPPEECQEAEAILETTVSHYLENRMKNTTEDVTPISQTITVLSEQFVDDQSQSVVYMPANLISEDGIGALKSTDSVLVIHREEHSSELPTAISSNLTDSEMTSIQIVMDANGQVISANQNVSTCEVTTSSGGCASAGSSHSEANDGLRKSSSDGDSVATPILFQVLTEDGMFHNINLDPVNINAGPENMDNSLEPTRPKQIVAMDPNEEKPFQCDLCSATFSRLGNYTRHRMIHTIHIKEDYRYKCEECGRIFLQRCDLSRHMHVHTGVFPFTCDTCNKGYIRRSDLVVHQRFHNKDRSFKCQQCPKAFFQSGDLRRHVRKVHEQVKPLTCGHCQRKFSKEATLIRHMQTVHRDIILTSLSSKFPLPLDVQQELSTPSRTKTVTIEKSAEVT